MARIPIPHLTHQSMLPFEPTPFIKVLPALSSLPPLLFILLLLQVHVFLHLLFGLFMMLSPFFIGFGCFVSFNLLLNFIVRIDGLDGHFFVVVEDVIEAFLHDGSDLFAAF